MPWLGLVRARLTSTPAPGLLSTPSCSGITKPSRARMGSRGYPCAAVARGGMTSSSTPCASAATSVGPASRSLEILASCRSSGSVAVAGAELVVVAQAPLSKAGEGSAAGERKPCRIAYCCVSCNLHTGIWRIGRRAQVAQCARGDRDLHACRFG
ncbi:hypothetical protein EDB86DRAFT_2967751 [Lactarius hatsudake]|nr:hypothetical protein EDB86DRAFT_2967751 [Lactarius hatsudake]